LSPSAGFELLRSESRLGELAVRHRREAANRGAYDLASIAQNALSPKAFSRCINGF